MQPRILAILGCAILSVALTACGGGVSSSGGSTNSSNSGTSNKGTPGTGTATQEPSSFTISTIAGPGTAIVVNQPDIIEGGSSTVGFYLVPGFTRMQMSGDCIPSLGPFTTPSMHVQTWRITDNCTISAHAEAEPEEREESHLTSLQVFPSAVYLHEITEGTAEIEIFVRLRGKLGRLSNNEPARIAKITATASAPTPTEFHYDNGWTTALEPIAPGGDPDDIGIYKGVIRPHSEPSLIYRDRFSYDGARVIYIHVQLWDALGNRLQPHNEQFQTGTYTQGLISQPIIVLDNHIPLAGTIASMDGFDVYEHFIHVREDDIHLIDNETYVLDRIMQIYRSSQRLDNNQRSLN